MTKTTILDYHAIRNSPFLHGGGKYATDQLISLLNLNGSEKVLEVGFGTGTTLVRLKSLYPNIDLYGLELSTLMLHHAIKRFKFVGLAIQNLRLLDQGVIKFPYDPKTFDVVIYESVLSIMSLDEIKENLKEVRRVLKPGGILVTNESIWLDSVTVEEIYQINHYCNDKFGIHVAHQILHSTEDWLNLFTAEKFEIKSVGYIDDKYKLKPLKLKDYLSMCYSYLGKMNPRLWLHGIRYKKAMEELNRSLFRKKQVIAAKIFILKSV